LTSELIAIIIYISENVKAQSGFTR